MIGELAALVNIDSPTGDVQALLPAAEHVQMLFADVGVVSRLRSGDRDAPHVLVEVGAPVDGRAPLVMCHYDTVWPASTAARWPFEVRNDAATGPGVLDMKASIVAVHYALMALRDLAVSLPAGVRVLITADEEIHNPTSRDIIADLAARSGMALVMEPPLADGRLKTQRKGHANVEIRVDGRAAHAGVEPEKGISAAIEAAHIALAAHNLGDASVGTIVNVGVIRAGTLPNIVAARAELQLEVRADTDSEVVRVLAALRRIRPRLEGSHIAVTLGAERPSMPRRPETDEVLAVAREVGKTLGLMVEEGSTGGVSEANFTQAAGTPTLDGLGIQGRGAHTPMEQIHVPSLFERTALLAGILAVLTTTWEGVGGDGAPATM